MRDIKFRVWKPIYTPSGSPSIGEMIYDIKCGNSIWNNEDIDINKILKYTPRLMQYIGLKDKNGVEIYELDILKVTSNGYSNYISFQGNNCYVEYNEDRCGFIATTGNGYDTRNCFALNCDAGIEVIGNIYENPELLQTK